MCPFDATRDHVSSPERRNSSDARGKCFHQACYEREQQTARELQKLRDSFGALKLEKDKEIAFPRDQPTAYTSMSKSPMRVAGAGVTMPSQTLLDVLDTKYYEENVQMSMVSDMLWGDPASEERESSMDSKGFGKSLRGGVAVSFGEKAIERFLQQHTFSRILRAHEAKMDGIAVSKSARVITIFSTSKDHGLGEDAKCGCLLIDHGKISAINRSPQGTKNPQLQRRRSLSFQTELHNGGAATGSPLRVGQESGSSAGTAGSASMGIARPRSNFQDSTLTEVLSNGQDDDDGNAPRADRATPTDTNDGGSESTDDEDDQSSPRRPRTRVISQSSSTVDRATAVDGCVHPRATSTSSVHSPSSATPALARGHAEDDEGNNQNDDI